MKQYPNLETLLEARAQQRHAANLSCGGVFDENGKQRSDINAKRRVVGTKTTYVHTDLAKIILGFNLSPNALCARFIKNFGYVEYFGDES